MMIGRCLRRALCICVAAATGLWAQDAADKTTKQAPENPAVTKARELTAHLTWAEPDKGRETVEKLLDAGPPVVRALIGLLTPASDGGDVNARFALEALVLHVQREGAETQRLWVSRTLAGQLSSVESADIRAFLMRRLQRVGGDEAVASLAAYLGDKELGEPAAQALVGIGGSAAAAALRTALPTAADETRLPLVKALGDLSDREAIPLIRPYASSTEPALRHTAWYALARAADAKVINTLKTALENGSPHDRNVARRMLFMVAETLGSGGSTVEGAALCRDLVHREGLTTGSLATLVKLLDTGALPDLLAAVDRHGPDVRAAVLRLALEIDGKAATNAWIEKARSAEPETGVAIIRMLGLRGDMAAWNAIHSMLGNGNPGIRQGAMQALRRLDAQKALPILVETVATGEKADADAAAANLRLIRAEDVPAAAAAAVPQAASHGKVALIDLLGARNARAQADVVLQALADGDKEVRKSALSALERLADGKHLPALLEFLLGTDASADRKGAQSVLVALSRRDASVIPKLVTVTRDASTSRARIALLRTLSRIGGDAALEAVLEAVGEDDTTIRDAAVRALAEWPDASAAAPLLEIVGSTKSDVHRVLALRGIVRLAALPASGSAEARAVMLANAFEAAGSVADRKLVLGGLGSVRHVKALDLAEKCLGTPELREEACAAIVAITCPRDRNDNGMRTYRAYEALRKAAEQTASKSLAGKAEKQLGALAPVVSTNVAMGMPVSISCNQQGDHSPKGAVDGKLTRDTAYWGHAWPSWFQVDLQQVRKIDTVRIIFYWDGRRFYTYTAEVSKDGKTWQKVADNSKNSTPADAKGMVHRFAPVEARYVRVNILKNSVNEAVHIVELEVYAAGSAPKAFASSEPVPAAAPPLPAPDKDGFIALFNGRDLSGWVGSVKGYEAKDGVLWCRKQGGGRLLTAYRFSDFVLSFDFKLSEGANNGLAIRSPLQGNPAYAGMELQIIDNQGYEKVHNYKLKPYQVHGSIYGVVPAKTGALKPVGEWNHQEVHAVGSHIEVVLNGTTIVDADVDAVAEAADGKPLSDHPGLKRRNGHIGWLGHGADVAFRNIRIKPLDPYTRGPHNTPPKGYGALFNGKTLDGWKGLVANPEKRAKMTPEQLAAAQKQADEHMRAHWQIVDGTLVFDGKGQSLCTARDYSDFDMFVDWKIKPKGDSGIYLRGSPQVQIWDPASHPEGSGGLYNNQKHPSKPTECMDNPIGQWNRFRIRMIGERVSIWLNGQNVVDNVVMENYWNRNKPINPSGQIELQNHGNTLYFRNIYLKDLTAEAAKKEGNTADRKAP